MLWQFPTPTKCKILLMNLYGFLKHTKYYVHKSKWRAPTFLVIFSFQQYERTLV